MTNEKKTYQNKANTMPARKNFLAHLKKDEYTTEQHN